ncbi:50S ribosomal protein L9 [Rappaport israeli]|uniref:50S ribosomal protein L9 n=1 Tax=Rappaport israeli TaxID=1839807 RepID=UPI000930E0B5|nr:50S ribosomal protein L9 [Rappaport israeli]
MELILLEKIAGLGELGDKVSVKAGYGRNFLIPSGKATEATAANLKAFEARRAELEKQQAEKLADAQNRAKALDGQVLTVEAKSGDEGKLFGSVGPQNIVEAAQKQGFTLEKHEVLMPHGTIRELGEFPIDLKLFGDTQCQVIVKVVSE